MNESEKKLPKWAQTELALLRYENKMLDDLRAAHQVLMDREWFTLSGPTFLDQETYRTLWVLDREDPVRVCSLGKGDVLLIGRAKK